jgi:NodT family efflux transporter outer membrane factor (OMF) lipoprotein
LPRAGGKGLRNVVLLVAATSLVATSGCMVGPNFTAPDAPATARYTSPDESARLALGGPGTARQTLAYGEQAAADWWRLFRSDALDDLVKQAIADNPTLASAQARLAQAREAVAAASAALYPQIGVNAGVSEERISAVSFGLQPSAFPLPPNFSLYQLGADASFTPDLFGGAHREIEEQAALADFQGYQLDAAYLTLTMNIVIQAVQVASVRAQLGAVDGILDIDRQNLDLVRKENQFGTIPESDLVVAAGQLAADETLRPGLEQQLSVTKHALAVLLGRAPGDWSSPAFDLASLKLPSRLPVTLPSKLIHQRPDILAAEAQLRAASAQIGVATAQLYPSLTLSASGGADALNPTQLFNPAGLVWSIAAGLTEPAFDGGLRQAERRAALDAFKASAADYKKTVLAAFEQVADLLEGLVHDASLLAAQKRALDTASQALRLQRISYASGGTGILGLLDAERQYQQASLGYIRAQAQRYLDTVQLLGAMGGSWWSEILPISSAGQAGHFAHS